jgi:hypothetical protein
MGIAAAVIFSWAQERFELPEFRAGYAYVAPGGGGTGRSVPLVIDLGAGLRLPGWGALVPDRREGPPEEAFVRACLADLKTRKRIDPQRVVAAGARERAPDVLDLGAAADDVLAGIVLLAPARFKPPGRSPPLLLVLDGAHPDRAAAVAAAAAMRKAGASVELMPAGEAAPVRWAEQALRIRPAYEALDEFVRQGRILDASLSGLELLDRPETEAFARTRFRSLEGSGLIELGKVEISVSERRYKDAYLRCKAGAREFSWLPVGQRLRSRLGELEAKAEVKKALEDRD